MIMNENRTYGYYLKRKDQNDKANLDELKKYIALERDIYCDDADAESRDQFYYLMNNLIQGDTVYLSTIDGIIDNKEFMNILHKLKKLRIAVHVLDLPSTMKSFSKPAVIYCDIYNFIINFLTDVVATKIRQEISISKKWQSLGIEESKRQGTKLGRKPKPYPETWLSDYRSWKAGEITARTLYSRYGWSNPCFYRKVKQFENQQVACL